MSFPFDARRGPVFVEASLSGPRGQADLRLILDTGATTSLVRSTLLVAVGYDPDASPDRIPVAMGNGRVAGVVPTPACRLSTGVGTTPATRPQLA